MMHTRTVPAAVAALRAVAAVVLLVIAPGCRGAVPPPELHRFSANYRIVSQAFSSDGQWLAAGSQQPTASPGVRLKGEVTVWNLKTGKQAAALPQAQWVQDVAFSPDGQLLAVAVGQIKSSDEITRVGEKPFSGEVILYQARNFQKQAAIPLEIPTSSVVFTPDGKTLVVACIGSNSKGEDIRLLDVAEKKERARLKGIQSTFPAVAIAPDGKTLAVCDLVRGPANPMAQIRFFDLATDKEQPSLHLQTELPPSGIAYFPDGKSMLLIGTNAISQLDLDTGTVAKFKGMPQHGADGGYGLSPDGKVLALCQLVKGSKQEARFLVWDVSAGKARASWSLENQSYRCLRFSPNGKLLAAGGLGPPPGGLVNLWTVP